MYNFPMMNNPMYPQFNPTPNMNIQNYNQPQFKINQVSTIDEAKSCLIDPLSTYLFINFSNGEIYMKRMNNNGLSEFYTFAIKENENIKNTSDPLSEINKRLENIENKLGGINNVQSVSENSKSNINGSISNDATNEKSKSSTISKSSGNDER